MQPLLLPSTQHSSHVCEVVHWTVIWSCSTNLTWERNLRTLVSRIIQRALPLAKLCPCCECPFCELLSVNVVPSVLLAFKHAGCKSIFGRVNTCVQLFVFPSTLVHIMSHNLAFEGKAAVMEAICSSGYCPKFSK